VGAAGKSYKLPFVGRLESVALASKRAALRLVFRTHLKKHKSASSMNKVKEWT